MQKNDRKNEKIKTPTPSSGACWKGHPKTKTKNFLRRRSRKLRKMRRSAKKVNHQKKTNKHKKAKTCKTLWNHTNPETLLVTFHCFSLFCGEGTHTRGTFVTLLSLQYFFLFFFWRLMHRKVCHFSFVVQKGSTPRCFGCFDVSSTP